MECKYRCYNSKSKHLSELIETLWNVNLYQGKDYTRLGRRINRNIVECKYLCCKIAHFLIHELIETLWNVNYLSVGDITSNRTELIETLWNVNIGNYLSQYSGN